MGTIDVKLFNDSEEAHQQLSDMYIEAARNSKQANVDADVQIGLGLLFYNAHAYTKAVDCFNAALSVRPDDYLLWNRLGATLANSGESELAIDAYYRALQLKPAFVRARYNLGVSCINVGCYKEAAEHFLSALSLHVVASSEVSRNVSMNLWDTLRKTFMLV